jgi:zinc transport system substrate-binding protein
MVKKMKPLRKLFLPILFALLSFTGNSMAGDKIPVFVSILPQKYFVEQIGKDLVDVQAMVRLGASPATYEPKPQQMVALSKAKIYFAIGVPFENAWLEKIVAANPDMNVVHTDKGIHKLKMEAHHHHDEDAEKHDDEKHHDDVAKDEDHHQHEGLDPHIWLSPPLVKIQASAILTALQAADPAHKAIYEENFNDFIARIDQLDSELKKTFAGKKGLQFMVFHPAWGYFAQAYGLHQVPIELEGKDPKPAQLKELIEHSRENGIKVIFVQPQFSTKSAKIVAREIGGQVAFADSLAEDWMGNLRQVADMFKEALK